MVAAVHLSVTMGQTPEQFCAHKKKENNASLQILSGILTTTFVYVSVWKVKATLTHLRFFFYPLAEMKDLTFLKWFDLFHFFSSETVFVLPGEPRTSALSINPPSPRSIAHVSFIISFLKLSITFFTPPSSFPLSLWSWQFHYSSCGPH